MAKVGLYKGFSIHEFVKSGRFSMMDVELVKMDLLNHIFTSKGSRVKMPTFGTNIPSYTFEPLTDDMVDLIEEELIEVFNHDPRVEILTLNINPDFARNAITVEAKLDYIELDNVGDFELNISFNQ